MSKLLSLNSWITCCWREHKFVYLSSLLSGLFSNLVRWLSFCSSVLVDQDSCRNHCGPFHQLSESLSCCKVVPRDIMSAELSAPFTYCQCSYTDNSSFISITRLATKDFHRETSSWIQCNAILESNHANMSSMDTLRLRWTLMIKCAGPRCTTPIVEVDLIGITRDLEHKIWNTDLLKGDLGCR